MTTQKKKWTVRLFDFKASSFITEVIFCTHASEVKKIIKDKYNNKVDILSMKY